MEWEALLGCVGGFVLMGDRQDPAVSIPFVVIIIKSQRLELWGTLGGVGEREASAHFLKHGML